MWMDWDERLLHVLRHEHRVHLALPQGTCTSVGGCTRGTARPVWCPRCGTSISQHELFAGGVTGTRAPVAVRSASAEGARRASRSSSGRRRPGRCRRTSPRRSSPTADYGLKTNGEWVAPCARAGRDCSSASRRSAASSSGSSTRARSTTSRAVGVRAPRDPVGRRHARRGNRDRPHRARRGGRGLRALDGPRPPPCSRRSTRPGGCSASTASTAVDGRGRGARHPRPRRARAA